MRCGPTTEEGKGRGREHLEAPAYLEMEALVHGLRVDPMCACSFPPFRAIFSFFFHCSGVTRGAALSLRPRVPSGMCMRPSGVPLVRPFHPFCVCVSFPDGSKYASFSYKYAHLHAVNRPLHSDTEACGVDFAGFGPARPQYHDRVAASGDGGLDRDAFGKGAVDIIFGAVVRHGVNANDELRRLARSAGREFRREGNFVA